MQSFSLISLLVGLAAAFPLDSVSSRRAWLRGLIALPFVGSELVRRPIPAEAAETEQDVYFGVGCFWHIQHEFVVAERSVLQRGDSQLTSRAGYAGGKAVGDGGRVCYHNILSVADYGRLGHGEVVGISLPDDQVVPFTKFYFSLFNPRTKGALLWNRT